MILISLLNRYDLSIFPILLEFKDDVKKHILIHDSSKIETKKVKEILKVQDKFKETYNLNYKSYSLKINEDSFDDIVHCYEQILKLSNNNYEQLYFINCLNSLPSCSVILSSKLLQKNGNLISYENFENGYRIISNKCMKINSTTNKEDISEFLSKSCEFLS